MSTRRSPVSSIALALPLVLTLAFAGWVRVSGYADVLGADAVRPLTNDAVYHVYRSLAAVRQFPHVPTRDPLLGWPAGDDCLWAPGYDFISALAVIALGAGGDEHAAGRVLVFVPVLLGLLVVWLVGRVALRLFDAAEPPARAVATLSRVLCAGLPIAIFTSQLGRTDHHVTEELTVLGLLWLTLLRVDRAPLATRSRQARLGFELATALVVGFGLWVWTGATLYVVMALLVLAFASLLEPTVEADGRARVLGSGGPGALLGAALGLWAYAEPLRAHGEALSFLYPSRMQPGICALAAAGVLATVVAARVFPLSATSLAQARSALLKRALLALALFAPLCALAWPLVAELWAGARAMLDVAGDAGNTILEFQPLVHADQALDADGWIKALRYFGPLALLGLPLCVLGVASLWRGAPAKAAVLGYFTLVLVVLTARQSRFARELAPVLAIAAALGLWRCAQVVLARRAGAQADAQAGAQATTRGTASLALGLAAALVLASEPTWKRLSPASPTPMRGAQAAGAFLAEHAAPRANGTRAGALTDSFSGAFLMWPARVPVVANNMGAKREVTDALTGDEAEALAFMRTHDLAWFVPSTEQYVQIELAPDHQRLITLAPDGRGVIDPRFLQRMPLAVAVLGGGGIAELAVPHLRSLLPRWAAPDALPGVAFFLPSAWVYERVAGARLRGRTAPRAGVVAQLSLHVGEHPLPYNAFTRSDAEGAFELSLPLPSRYRSANLSTSESYALIVEGDSAPPTSVAVSEHDVRAGTVIELGTLGTLAPKAP